jgi:hypothetical protein
MLVDPTEGAIAVGEPQDHAAPHREQRFESSQKIRQIGLRYMLDYIEGYE